ncbi:hypothetical protein [Acinetobacter stercoris]|uniref:Lipoprotein n=1 Tax=Acinetobacter stercoris TaxID=2126983 RepID=A0A2U3MZB1_9GAMM|nr:hypothetical protein [Acinetobacter stercoris]SPL70760.1 hypothetical protein KPC_1938 [Acinetobacter stercoris]
MKIIIFIILAFALLACHNKPENKLAQQQHQICKSLIQSYLKANHLGDYYLYRLQPTLLTQSNQREYTYKNASDAAAKLNNISPKKFTFECHQTAQQQYVLSLKIPNKLSQTLIHTDTDPTIQATAASTLAFLPKTQ